MSIKNVNTFLSNDIMITFTQYLAEQRYLAEQQVGPFEHAYEVENAVEQRECNKLYRWVATEMQCNASAPKFYIVGHHHMQRAARKIGHFNPINGEVYGWFSQTMPDKVFISDKISIRSKTGRAVIAHELAHYCQWQMKSELDHAELEQQADDIMYLYLKSK